MAIKNSEILFDFKESQSTDGKISEQKEKNFDVKTINENEKFESEDVSDENLRYISDNKLLFSDGLLKISSDRESSKTTKHRKSSSASTLSSKDSDFPEYNCSSTEIILPIIKNEQIYIQSSFFGHENNDSNMMSNYFLETQNHLRELYPEKNDYCKTRNYPKKETFLASKPNKIFESKLTFTQNRLDEKISKDNVFNNIKNLKFRFPYKGKFDIPFSCQLINDWECKNIYLL